MGESLEEWRARIGGFIMPGTKSTGNIRGVAIPAWARLTLRVVLFLACCASVTGGLDLPVTVHTSTIIVPVDLCLVRGQCRFDGCSGIPEINGAWSQSVHSAQTRVCSVDIESNPGPTGQQSAGPAANTRKQSTLTSEAGHLTFSRDSREVEPSLVDVMRELRGMRGEMKSLSERLTSDVQQMKKDMTEFRGNYETIMNELESMRNENRKLKRQLDNMEGQARRNNIVISGIPESRGEEWNESEKLVRQSLCENLKLAPDYVNSIPIERAHRLRRTIQTNPNMKKNRDIIVKFSFFKDKEAVLKAARRERPVGLFFGEDFTQTVKHIRFKLKEKMTSVRAAGLDLKAFLVFDKLMVMNSEGKRNAYTYDCETETVKTLYQNFREPATETTLQSDEHQTVTENDDS